MIIFILLTISLTTPVYLHNTDPTTRISIALKEFIETGVKSNNLSEAVESLKNLTDKTFQNEQTCLTCKYVVDGVIQYRKSGVTKDLMMKLIYELCLTFTDWGEEGCKGSVNIEIDSLLYMMDNRKNLTAERVCAIYLQQYLCKDPNSQDWSINIPNKINENTIEFNEIPNGSGTLKVLHLTDIHVDPLYIPGSNALCDKPLCCRSGTPEKPEDAAGYWGDYNVCDMPWHSIFNLMDQIKKEHSQIDYVYYTGDIISHASWLTTRETNERDIKELFDLFLKTFNAIPVYPVLGNHESHPSNYYSSENVSADVTTEWLFNLVSEDWSKWLPEDCQRTIKTGGYYTVLVKKGFRIIALNSNICYTGNLWLIYDDVDPHGQLQWFADTLADAEKNGEFVHILSHVPPGSLECWQKWSNQFNKIIRRFSNTIKAQFNGHTHIDEIRIFLDDTNSNAINVAYNGGSFTTFVGMNPNYRIYDMDSNTYEITDYENWIYSMADANKSKDKLPEWYKLYSLKEAYGLNSTSMEDLFDLVQRMKSDPEKELMKQYFKFEVRESPVNLAKGCDNNCLDTLLCYITTLDFDEAIKC